MCNVEQESMVHILYNVLLYILTELTGLDFVRIIQRTSFTVDRGELL